MNFATLMRKSLIVFGVVMLVMHSTHHAQSATQEVAQMPKQELQMTTYQAVILGVTEGITEYLPVSSTGHLYLVEQLMGIGDQSTEKQAADGYAICIQLGAILAVMWLYFGRVRQMMNGVLRRDVKGRRLLINTLCAFTPAAIVGVICEPWIKQLLFGLWPISAAWFLGGVCLIAVARCKRRSKKHHIGLDDMTVRQSLTIGCMQCICLWPGISRSLTTIVGGLWMGMSAEAAVEFSFILGLVTIGAATIYETMTHGMVIVRAFGWQCPLLGCVVAFVSAVAAVRCMLSLLDKNGLMLFGYYRVILSVIIAWTVLAQALS